MDGAKAYRIAMLAEQKKDLERSKTNDDNRSLTRKRYEETGQNHQEDLMAAAIDHKNTLLKLQKQLERLSKTSDVKGFIEDIAPETVLELALLAHDPKTASKIRLAAIQDILDRAGYNKVTKHAVARIDASESKEAIIASIKGAKKELKGVGIEITDEDLNQGSGEAQQG